MDGWIFPQNLESRDIDIELEIWKVNFLKSISPRLVML